MIYTKRPVSRNDSEKEDSLGTSATRTPLETEVFNLIQRIYPSRIVNLKAIAESPTKISGGFIGIDKKVYLYNLDLAKKELEYGLNQFKTPQRALRSDARRKDPNCKESIPCEGPRGVGCISKRKKCQQRLNRISSPMQRMNLEKLAQEEFGEREQIAFKKKLGEQGIRELRGIAKEAGIGNYGNQSKEVLVNTLTKLKEMESSTIQTRGQYGTTNYTSEEDAMRRTLARREEQRKNNLYVGPIDPSKVALTKEQIAIKRAEDDQKRRRVQASKRALSALFPGATKVVEEFAKASTIDDKVIAGLVAGVFALRMYQSSKSEFENNYRKGIEEQADMLYNSDKFINTDKNPGVDIKELTHYYEKEGLSKDESVVYAGTFTNEKGKPLTMPASDKADGWQETLELARSGGRPEDDLRWQKADQERKIRAGAASDITRAEAALGGQDRKLKLQEAQLRRADDLNKAVRDKIMELDRRIVGAKEGEEFIVPDVLITHELDDLVKGKSRSADSEQKLAAYVAKELKDNPPENQGEEKRRKQSLEDEFNLQETIGALGQGTRTVTIEKMIEAKNYLEQIDKNNFTTHRETLARQTANLKDIVDDANEKLTEVQQKWAYLDSGTEADKKKVKSVVDQAAADEMERRSLLKTTPKPLFPDFGTIEEGKLTRYQTWVMAKYTSQRGNDVLVANNAVRDDPSKYSLTQFKKELSSAIVVGSETGKANEVAAALSTNPAFKNVRFIPVENEYSSNSSLGESEPSGLPYLGRLGRYMKKIIPANNRIPGLNPTKSNNDDATVLASKIIALQRYGIEPKIVTHGVGGSILQEALDIVAASKDGKALEAVQTVNFGVPKMITPSRKKVEGKMRSYYGSEDFFAKNFGGTQKELLPSIEGAGYKDYISSPSGIDMIKKLFI